MDEHVTRAVPLHVAPPLPGVITDDAHRRALELLEGAMRLVTMNDRRAAEQFRGSCAWRSARPR